MLLNYLQFNFPMKTIITTLTSSAVSFLLMALLAVVLFRGKKDIFAAVVLFLNAAYSLVNFFSNLNVLTAFMQQPSMLANMVLVRVALVFIYLCGVLFYGYAGLVCLLNKKLSGKISAAVLVLVAVLQFVLSCAQIVAQQTVNGFTMTVIVTILFTIAMQLVPFVGSCLTGLAVAGSRKV